MSRNSIGAHPTRTANIGSAVGGLIGASLLVGLVLAPDAAEAEIWRLARGPSSVEFSVKHLVFSEVAGRFGRFDGSVDCPGDDFADATVEVTIDVATVYTGHADRDRELLTADFFEVERFPQMRFESRAIERTGPERYRLVGDLTIRGVTHEVELEALYGGERETAGRKRRDFHATTTVNRSDYGLSWNDTWAGKALVGEKVDITLAIALVEAPGRCRPRAYRSHRPQVTGVSDADAQKLGGFSPSRG